jgi:hypothetical protein
MIIIKCDSSCSIGKSCPCDNQFSAVQWRRVGEWMYRSTFSWSRHYLEMSGQLHSRATDVHWIGDSVGPRIGLDDLDPSTSVSTALLASEYLTANALLQLTELCTSPRDEPDRKHLSQQFNFCVTKKSHGPRREHLFPVTPLMSITNLLRQIRSNCHFLQSHYLSTGLHDTVYYCKVGCTSCVILRKATNILFYFVIEVVCIETF